MRQWFKKEGVFDLRHRWFPKTTEKHPCNRPQESRFYFGGKSTSLSKKEKWRERTRTWALIAKAGSMFQVPFVQRRAHACRHSSLSFSLAMHVIRTVSILIHGSRLSVLAVPLCAMYFMLQGLPPITTQINQFFFFYISILQLALENSRQIIVHSLLSLACPDTTILLFSDQVRRE